MGITSFGGVPYRYQRTRSSSFTMSSTWSPLLHPVPKTVSSQPHRFRIENSSGGGFDFISNGPNSPDVPAQAVTVDNTSPDIILQNASQWTLTADIACYEKTRWWSTIPGASLSYSFSGIAIWYDCIPHTMQSLTCSVGTMLEVAQIQPSSLYPLTVRHRSA